MIDLNKRVGEAMEFAAGNLPIEYELEIKIEYGSANVSLFIPPCSDEDGGKVIHFNHVQDLPYSIRSAVEMAILDANKNNEDSPHI